jgi:hypothetical protein
LCMNTQTHFQNYISNGSFDRISVTFPNGNYLKDQYPEWDEYTSIGGFFNNSYFPNMTPNTYVGYQLPFKGKGMYYMIFIGNVNIPCSESQSYIQCKLRKKLSMNRSYRGRFYSTLADSVDIATSRLGMYISANKPTPIYLQPNNQNPYIQAIPQIQRPYGSAVTDTMNWTKIEDVFIASSNMQYMTLGNFYRANQTDTFRVGNRFSPSGACWNEGAAYFLDNLSLVEEDRAVAYKDTSKNYLCVKQGTSKVLGDTAERPWLQYEWKNKQGAIVGTNRNYTYNAALLENTFFTVRIIDTGEYAFITKAVDTIFIYTSVSPDTVSCQPVGLAEVLKDAERIEMYYNDGTIKFNELHERFTGADLVIKSIDGKVIFKTKLERKKYNYNINTEMKKGFYFVEIVYEGQGIKRRKIIIE